MKSIKLNLIPPLLSSAGTYVTTIAGWIKFPPSSEEETIPRTLITIIVILVCSFLLALLYSKIKKSRKSTFLLIFTFVVYLVTTLASLALYDKNIREKTEYNHYTKSREVVGDTITAIFQPKYDSLKKAKLGKRVSRQELIENVGDPNRIWERSQLDYNSRILFCYFLASIALIFCLLRTILEGLKQFSKKVDNLVTNSSPQP